MSERENTDEVINLLASLKQSPTIDEVKTKSPSQAHINKINVVASAPSRETNSNAFEQKKSKVFEPIFEVYLFFF
jgi:hypothetical protein